MIRVSRVFLICPAVNESNVFKDVLLSLTACFREESVRLSLRGLIRLEIVRRCPGRLLVVDGDPTSPARESRDFDSKRDVFVIVPVVEFFLSDVGTWLRINE